MKSKKKSSKSRSKKKSVKKRPVKRATISEQAKQKTLTITIPVLNPIQANPSFFPIYSISGDTYLYNPASGEYSIPEAPLDQSDLLKDGSTNIEEEIALQAKEEMKPKSFLGWLWHSVNDFFWGE